MLDKFLKCIIFIQIHELVCLLGVKWLHIKYLCIIRSL